VNPKSTDSHTQQLRAQPVGTVDQFLLAMGHRHFN
jgi:hypothetical protein